MNVPAIADRRRKDRMTKDELITWAKANGFTEDRFGHLQKTNGTSRYRLKLSSIAAPDPLSRLRGERKNAMNSQAIQTTKTPSGRRAILFCLLFVSAHTLLTLAAFAQAPYDLWTPDVLQKSKDQSTLNLQLVPRVGYLEVFFNSEVNTANWFEDSG